MIDWMLAFGAVIFSGVLAFLAVRGWRAFDRWAERRVGTELAEATDAVEQEAVERRLDHESATCGVPTYGPERCGLLAGHADRRHLSWPSGRPYPPDDDPAPDDQVLEVDPPVVPRERLNAVGGWVDIGGRRVHRSCAEDRRDGRHERVCTVCADRLGMAPAGGAT